MLNVTSLRSTKVTRPHPRQQTSRSRIRCNIRLWIMVHCLSIASQSHTGRMQSASSQNHNQSTYMQLPISSSSSLIIKNIMFILLLFWGFCVFIIALSNYAFYSSVSIVVFIPFYIKTGQVLSRQVYVFILSLLNFMPIITFKIVSIFTDFIMIIMLQLILKLYHAYCHLICCSGGSVLTVQILFYYCGKGQI